MDACQPRRRCAGKPQRCWRQGQRPRQLNSVPQSWKLLELPQKRRQGGKWRRPLQLLTWLDSRLRETCLDPVLQQRQLSSVPEML